MWWCKVISEHDEFPTDSPVFPFLDAVMASLEKVAPERAGELRQVVESLDLRLVVEQGSESLFRARATNGRRDICYSIYGAEAWWGAAFSYTTLHRAMKESSRREFDFAEDFPDVPLARLLEWAFDERIARGATSPFPTELPRPRFVSPGEDPTTVHLATELWLCAMAWALHHELAHQTLGHLELSLLRIGDEVDADEAATGWLLDEVEDKMAKTKRSLGIAIAVGVLAGTALHRNERRPVGGRTHPPAGERVLRAMSHHSFPDNHPAQELAIVAVCLHMQRFGIQTPAGPFEDTSDALAVVCRALTDWELAR